MADMEIETKNDFEEEDEEFNKLEYSVWKKNSKYLYDFLLTNTLSWPSLTVEWLSKTIELSGREFYEQQMVLGTHTANNEQNYLMIANVKIPYPQLLKCIALDAMIDAKYWNEEKRELGKYGGQGADFRIGIKINHDGEINRARAMPQDEIFIATRTIDGPINIFDVSKHPSTPSDDGVCKPNMRLIGQEKEGYGLDWNKQIKGQLLSCGDDSLICMFDINSEGATEISSKLKFKAHDGIVGDVAWNRNNGNTFGSVGEDKKLKIWDCRSLSGETPKAVQAVNAHDDDINSLSMSLANKNYILTGGADAMIKLWDSRNMSNSLHEFEGHKDNILQIQWSPFSEAIFASCSEDRRVMIWDLSRIGEEQTADDAMDGPPELLFTHGGHCSPWLGKVSDFSWNPSREWMISSVEQSNILHSWTPSSDIYHEETLKEAADKLKPEDISFKEPNIESFVNLASNT